MKIYVWNTREYFTCQFHRKSVYYNITCISLSAIQVSKGLILIVDTLANTLYYYIHTKKYSPKSYVVNFRTQISSNQSEERTMVFTCEKNDTSNQNGERCFFTCEKNDTSKQKPQRCVSFAPKFPPFLAACSAASREKFYSKSFSR